MSGGATSKKYAGKEQKGGLTGMLIDLMVDATVDAAASAIDSALSVNFGPPDQMLSELSKKAISKFVKKITPQYVEANIALKDRDDDSGLSGLISVGQKPEQKAIDDALKVGCEFAKIDFWDKAISAWDSALKLKPTCAAAHYNKGVAYEMKGDLIGSKENIEKAVNAKSSEDYIKALRRIENKIEQKAKLEKQMRDRKESAKSIPKPEPVIYYVGHN